MCASHNYNNDFYTGVIQPGVVHGVKAQQGAQSAPDMCASHNYNNDFYADVMQEMGLVHGLT